MRRMTLILAVALVMVALITISAGTALAFDANACNQGTQHAHHEAIPEGVPGHEGVPECD